MRSLPGRSRPGCMFARLPTYPQPEGAPIVDLAAAIGATGLAVQPFQRRFLRGAFADGVSIAAYSTPRAAGKTELIGRVAGLGVVPGSPVFREGHEVVVFAGSMRQARHIFRAALRDAVRWPVETRLNQWSTASADIAAFRAAVLDGNFSVAEHCRRLAELSFAHARVERDTSGNAKLFKAHRRQRDDVAQAAVLGVAALARTPARPRRAYHGTT